jgi:hypothetical protein
MELLSGEKSLNTDELLAHILYLLLSSCPLLPYSPPVLSSPLLLSSPPLLSSFLSLSGKGIYDPPILYCMG